jgi:hypothetical protein
MVPISARAWHLPHAIAEALQPTSRLRRAEIDKQRVTFGVRNAAIQFRAVNGICYHGPAFVADPHSWCDRQERIEYDDHV